MRSSCVFVRITDWNCGTEYTVVLTATGDRLGRYFTHHKLTHTTKLTQKHDSTILCAFRFCHSVLDIGCRARYGASRRSCVGAVTYIDHSYNNLEKDIIIITKIVKCLPQRIRYG